MRSCLAERFFNEAPLWASLLADEFSKPYFASLNDFVSQAYATEQVFPKEEQLLSSFVLTSPERVKVVILGQDPYHGVGQAHGLSFSVQSGVPLPASLRNIFKEVSADCNVMVYPDGNLKRWANQGVFLQNSVLTVRKDEAGSHRGHGWEHLTDAVIARLSDCNEHLVFMLWGNSAQEKRSLIDLNKHLVLTAAHPSPLSAYRGFFGCHHFSQANAFLEAHQECPIDWR